MVVAAPPQILAEKIRETDLPIIDLSGERSEVSKLIVKACEEFGFFKVTNHGVSQDVINEMEAESFRFFARPAAEKQLAGPANPYGYGCKNIGFNGDFGEVEYLLLSANFLSISHRSKSISNDPLKFSSAVCGYVEAVRGLACEILDMMAEGVGVPQASSSVFSSLIRAVDNDSVFRLNHYPPLREAPDHVRRHHHHRVGFGEHSDPQLLTILRSNNVGGLQISPEDGVWIPVSADPTSFSVNVGDALQAMTSGRFVSVRHRALANSQEVRMSMAYFAAPPLHARIAAQPELTGRRRECLYRPFTWGEYKTVTYSLRLGERRLNRFKADEGDEII
ncbi:gibberellin 2-beta-dioxygenase 2-like [Diospyros lotus]|uniref:gibberellin 2-beta-dioxygenase 2-like n=1 Tax=Diospyros lotus TaxID=55363 RepID=UPI002259A4F0|nr:gibberellin 2-beta-dioxygenase 2-like [Diospyros lotus]